MGPLQATAELGVPPDAVGAVVGAAVGGGAVVGATVGLSPGELEPVGAGGVGLAPAWLPGPAQALRSTSSARPAINLPGAVGGTAETLTGKESQRKEFLADPMPLHRE